MSERPFQELRVLWQDVSELYILRGPALAMKERAWCAGRGPWIGQVRGYALTNVPALALPFNSDPAYPEPTFVNVITTVALRPTTTSG